MGQALSQSIGPQQQWTNKLDPDNPCGKTTPHTANTTQPQGSRLTPGIFQTWAPQASQAQDTEHMRLTARPSGWEVWKPGPGARHVMPTSTQTCWGVSEGANEKPLQCPGGSAPLPCAGGHCPGHQQREV